MNADFGMLDEGKVYCKHCFYDGVISELALDEEMHRYEPCKTHAYLTSNIRTLHFLDGKWKVCRGLAQNARPQKAAIHHNKCESCGYEEDTSQPISVWKCKMCGWYPKCSLKNLDHRKFVYEHKCANPECKMYGIAVSDNVIPQNWRCGSCGKCNVKVFKCEKCGEALERNLQKCPKCGFQKRLAYHCENCGAEISNPYVKCDKCGYKKEMECTCKNCGATMLMNGKCEKCGFSLLFEHRSKQAALNNERLNSFHVEFCEKCGHDTIHDGFGACVSCSPRGAQKRWQYNNSRLEYLDIEYGMYIDWEEKKRQILSSKVDHMDNLGGEVFPTFITKDSTLNCGHAAFDKFLVEEGVTYFSYVKYYVDKCGKILPLVAGVSASKLINDSGSDL